MVDKDLISIRSDIYAEITQSHITSSKHLLTSGAKGRAVYMLKDDFSFAKKSSHRKRAKKDDEQDVEANAQIQAFGEVEGFPRSLRDREHQLVDGLREGMQVSPSRDQALQLSA